MEGDRADLDRKLQIIRDRLHTLEDTKAAAEASAARLEMKLKMGAQRRVPPTPTRPNHAHASCALWRSSMQTPPFIDSLIHSFVH